MCKDDAAFEAKVVQGELNELHEELNPGLQEKEDEMSAEFKNSKEKVSEEATKLQKGTNMLVESREYSSKVVLKGLDEVGSAYSQLLPEGKKLVTKIVRRIKKTGFNYPILIFKNGIIMAGNLRYFAAQKLNLDTIPTLCWNDLSIDELNSYVEDSCDFAFDSNLFQEIYLVPVYSAGTLKRHSYLLEELGGFFEAPNPHFEP